MSQAQHPWRRLRVWMASGVALSLGTSLWAQAPEPERLPPPVGAAAAPAAQPPTLTLIDCLRLACERQPALAAERSSVAAAHTQVRALQQLGAAAKVTNPDLPIRRQQACLGVEIAEARLKQAEQDLGYNVMRLYFTVQYARSQKKIAEEIVESFGTYQKQVSEAVKDGKGPKEWTSSTVDKLTVYLRMAESKRIEAERGVERAQGALKELLGGGEDFPFLIPDEPLPEPKPKVMREEIIGLALSRRGEIIQTSRGAEVFDLEVAAQGKTLLPGKVSTFAAGGDIHATPVPLGTTYGEYRPSAVGPEMPTMLAGSRCSRMDRARDFASRASAVAQKTHNLIVLDAEDTYQRYLTARDQTAALRDAAKSGAQLAEDTRADFRGAQKVKIEDVLTNEVLSAQARTQFNEALLNYVIALASLERVTAGGFCAGFAEAIAKPPEGK
ncbi:MAG: TolC family protein [Planctomycetia bacterium]|nr:TolC family protein [Planctomycetia bacterium]